MGLFDFIRGLLGGSPNSVPESKPSPAINNLHTVRPAASVDEGAPVAIASSTTPPTTVERSTHSRDQLQRKKRPEVILRSLEYRPSTVPTPSAQEVVSGRPYRFATRGPRPGQYLNLSRDVDVRWLEYFGLPVLSTPEELANWLGIPLGRLAWLTHHTLENHRPKNASEAHYHFQWKQKRSGGWRLIEAPKEELKRVQQQILHQILDVVPAHPAAHGFVPDRSILTNAAPHVGSKFILKLDLENFYPSVRYSRIVAIFRSFGFSREVSLWLARLTTTAPPWGLDAPSKNWEYWQLMTHHLPQGAPTSPALANLSAYGLDVRLSGLAKAYNLHYTRYADDITFSGPGFSIPALNEFIPLTTKIITAERFTTNRKKRKIIRNSQRQSVTGVVVNEKINVSRQDYDQLKAILSNCVKLGPHTQNRNKHPNFSSHLRGRIAHVSQLNPARGEKLLVLYTQIRW